MDIEGVASFEVLAVEKALTFLKQEIVGSWAQDDFVGLIGDWLLDDLRFQDAASDSRQINAEQGLLICENQCLAKPDLTVSVRNSSRPKPNTSANGWIPDRTTVWISSAAGRAVVDVSRSKSRDSRGLPWKSTRADPPNKTKFSGNDVKIAAALSSMRTRVSASLF